MEYQLSFNEYVFREAAVAVSDQHRPHSNNPARVFKEFIFTERKLQKQQEIIE